MQCPPTHSHTNVHFQIGHSHRTGSQNLRPCSISPLLILVIYNIICTANYLLHAYLQNVWITLSGHIPCMPSSPLHAISKPDPVYEGPQLEDNPAYGAAGMAMVANEEENYETCYP